MKFLRNKCDTTSDVTNERKKSSMILGESNINGVINKRNFGSSNNFLNKSYNSNKGSA